MTKRIHAKHKIDRRLGENIWGRPKSPFNKREYGPGEHGQRRRGKLSDYGQQLRAKQKLKGYYGNITEKQFKAIYHEAARLRGDTSEKLIGLLGAAARRHRLSREIRADRVRRAPIREPRPCAGQRQAREHPELSLPRGRRGRGAGQGQGRRHGARIGAERRAAGARLSRCRPQQDDGEARRASRRSPTCLTR